MEKSNAYIFSSTPQELTGQPLDELQEFGLADCAVDVYAAHQEEATTYEAVLQAPDLDIRSFVGLLSTIAPSDDFQYPINIENDWVYARMPDSDNYKIHARLGAPWQELTEHIDPFLEIVRSGSEFWHPQAYNIDGYDHWRSTIPEPLAIEPEKWNYKSFAISTNELIHGLKAGGIEDVEKILLFMAKAVIDWGSGFKINEGPEFVRTQQKLQRVFYSKERYKQVAAFAKLPLRYRALVQGNVLAHALDDNKHIPLTRSGDYWSTFILRPSYSNEIPYYRKIIDQNGAQRVIKTDPSWGYDIPKDYRAFEQAEITTVVHANGLHSADALVIDLGRKHYKGGTVKKVFVDHRTIKCIKRVVARPVLQWQDAHTPSGEIRTTWNLSDAVQECVIDGVPTRTHQIGLLGLIAAAGYSKDILGHEKLWKQERKLPKIAAEQVMGAAQLPLLALMYQRQIARGSFINAIRQEVRAKTA